MKTEKLRFAVAVEKGGAGKSTTAMQILATYIHHKFNELVNYFEYDLKNMDCAAYSNSTIVLTECAKKEDDLPLMFDKIEKSNNAVMDVGGNLSTSLFIKELNSTYGFEIFDVFFIPFGPGSQDALNALKMYQIIRKKSSVKIIFVANMYEMPLDDDAYDFEYISRQFPMFFGDPTGRAANKNGIVNQIDESDRNFIAVPRTELFSWARGFNKTLYEIAITADERIKKTIAKIDSKYQNNEIDDDYKSLVMHRCKLSHAKQFLNEEMTSIWDRLDELLKVKSNG